MYSLVMYIDSHCHLDFPVFENLSDLLAACHEQGVLSFLVPSTTAQSWQSVLRLQKQYTEIQVALGLHPYFLEHYQPEQLQQLAHLLMEEKVVAVGEIGLDRWPGLPDFTLQCDVFECQLDMAKQAHLPVILHVRKAEDDVLKRLRAARFQEGGIVHAFNGSLEQAKRFIDMGFVLGIGGTVTYSRAQKARRVLQALSDQDFVLETDAPDMPIQGFQGQPNSPIRIVEIAACVAQLREQSLERIAYLTNENLQRVLPNWQKANRIDGTAKY